MKIETSRKYKEAPAFPYRLPQHFKLESQDMEHPSGVSITIPDESYTIKDLVQKFSQGIDPSISKLAEYSEDSDDHDQPDMRKLATADLSDVDNYKRELASRRLALLQDMEKQKTEANKKTEPVTNDEDQSADLRNDNEEPKDEEKKQPSRSTKSSDLKQSFKKN